MQPMPGHWQDSQQERGWHSCPSHLVKGKRLLEPPPAPSTLNKYINTNPDAKSNPELGFAGRGSLLAIPPPQRLLLLSALGSSQVPNEVYPRTTCPTGCALRSSFQG